MLLMNTTASVFRFLFLAIGLSIILLSCGGDKTAIDTPDVSDIKVEVDLIRYEEALMQMDPSKPETAYQQLLIKYPRMTDLYFKRLLGLYHPDRDTLNTRLSAFLLDERIRELANEVKSAYPKVDDIEKELSQALKYYKHYFPESTLPRFYTLFSEFGYQPFIFDDMDGQDGVGIGLDMFLGADYNYKAINPTDPVFSDYLTRTYDRAHLVKKTMEILVEDALGTPPGKRFIDQMIHQGKKAYVLKRILPTTPDSIIYEYTSRQMAWMENSELAVWDFLLELDCMYDTNHLKLSKLLNPGPTTQGMPEAAPGRTTAYIGNAIVSAFMKRNKDMNLVDLIQFRDSQLLMEESRYKPARR